MHGDTMRPSVGHVDSMQHRMMMEMMGPPSPAMILNHRADLGLTSDQVSRLEQLQRDAASACTMHMRLAMTTYQAANRLLEPAAPRFAAYSAKLKEAAGHMVEAHVAMAKAAVAARNVLTAAQRQTVKDRMAQMHQQP
jgi:Spy/CpxP family protein refolding chaperone